MPFDPNVPRAGTPPRSAEIRDNFVALKSLIDAVPAGPPGLQGEVGPDGPAGRDGDPGPAGPPGADSTVPGPQGPEGRSVVNVRDNGDGRAIVDMNDGSSYGPFTVASGPAGPQGERGSDGSPGPAGADGMAGPQGSPGMDGVSIVNVYDYGDGRAIVQLSNGQTFGPFYVATGPPGSPGERGSDGSPGAPGVDGRSLTMRGDWDSATSYNPGDLVAYNGNVYVALYAASDTPPDVDGRWRVMTITGPAGGQGPAGNDGAPGPQGLQGEVSNQQLTDAINYAIAGTSTNTNAVQTLDTYADLPTAISKLNELINALRR